MIAAVQAALEAVAQQLVLIRLDFPNLPPRQQEMLARSQCIEEITAANLALDHQAVTPSLRPPASAQQAMPGRQARAL